MGADFTRRIIKNSIKQEAPDIYELPPIQSEQVEKLMIDDFYEKIKNEIVEVEKERIKQEAREEIESEEKDKKLRSLKAFIVEGIVLAFIIGLLVNQITDIITYLKTNDLKLLSFLSTVVIVIGLSALGYFSYLKKLIDNALELVNEKGGKNGN